MGRGTVQVAVLRTGARSHLSHVYSEMEIKGRAMLMCSMGLLVLLATAGVRAGGPAWQQTDAGQTDARASTGSLDPQETGGNDELFQEPLHCIGTEPFWSLKVDSRVRFARMAEPYTILSGSRATPSSNHTNVWSLEARGAGSERAVLFLRRTDQCSDDMSDFRYRYEVFVRISGDVYSGCCNRLP